MAIHDLEVIVEVDISSALAKLTDLQDELDDVADAIRRVDQRGSDGIDVATTVDGIDAELAVLTMRIRQWEEAHDINVDSEIDVGSKITGFNSEMERIRAKIEGFEETNDVNVASNVTGHFSIRGIEASLTALEERIRRWEASHDISVDGTVDASFKIRGIGDELTRLRGRIRQFEASNSIDLDVDDINASFNVRGIGDELTRLNGRIAQYEAANSVDLDLDVDDGDLSDSSTSVVQHSIDDAITNIATMRVDAEVVHLEGAIGENFGDNLRNSVRKGFSDALNSEDVSILGGGGDSGASYGRVERDATAVSRRARLEGLMGGSDVSNSFDRMRGMQFGRPNRQQDLSRRLSGVTEALRDRLSDLAENSKITNLNMSDMHNVMARLIPLLIVLVGTIPAIYGAFITLAAAAGAAAAGLAALTAFGALGVALEGGEFNMQNLTDVWNDIRSSFIEAFAPLAERLEPLFMDGVRGLERFFQMIANEGDALMALTDEARAFGGFVMDFVPMALRNLAALAEAFAPVFSNIGGWIQDNFNNVMRTAVEITSEALPTIAKFFFLLADMVPTLMRLSVGFTEVASWVLIAVRAFGALLSIIPVSTETFGLLVGTLLAATTAVALLNLSMFRLAGSAFLTVIKGIATIITTLGGYIYSVTLSIMATYGLASAALFLISVVTLGIGAVAALGAAAATMGDHFSSAAGDINGAASALDKYDSVASGTGGSGFNPYGQGAGSTAPQQNNTTVNVESSGDRKQDTENARYASWRNGRTSGTRG